MTVCLHSNSSLQHGQHRSCTPCHKGRTSRSGFIIVLYCWVKAAGGRTHLLSLFPFFWFNQGISKTNTSEGDQLSNNKQVIKKQHSVIENFFFSTHTPNACGTFIFQNLAPGEELSMPRQDKGQGKKRSKFYTAIVK